MDFHHIKITRALLLAAALPLLALALLHATPAAAQDAPSRLTLDTADYHLKEFEKEVARAGGRAIGLTSSHAREAVKRIEDLAAKFPANARVKDMAARLATAVEAARGKTVTITPQMLEYRKREAEIREEMRKINVAAWTALRNELASGGSQLEHAFPAPDAERVPLADVTGRTVVLDGFVWPDHEFTHNGRAYTYVGDVRNAANGFWFVRTGDTPEFVGAYEAVKRYRRQVTSDLPTSWTVVGTIVGPQIMVPQEGEEKTLDAQFGWVVTPTAIWLTDRVLARHDAASAVGGHFAGEDRVQELLATGWSCRAEDVANDIEPAALVQLMLTAVKERNAPLYLACIEPQMRETKMQQDGLQQFWDIWQKSLATDYVHIEIDHVDAIERTAGVADPAHMFDPAAGKVQLDTVRVWIMRFDEKGTAVGSKKPVTLRRTVWPGQTDTPNRPARWYVTGGFPF